MGSGKKEKARLARGAGEGKGTGNLKVKGENFYRSAKKVKTLSMYKDGKAQRNADGKIIKAASYQSKEIPNARIEPNRKWFGNTRVISQDSLAAFRQAMEEQEKNPYQVLLKSNKLPMSLIRNNETTNGLQKHQAKILTEASPFSEVFGPRAQRKRVKHNFGSIDDLANDTEKSLDTFKERQEHLKLLSGKAGEAGNSAAEDDYAGALSVEPVFHKGQSKRIWNELYKVIDSSDVVLSVLDARDPLGTRCRAIEKYIANEAPHKHLVFILNKCDLVPTSVAANWVRILQKEKPTCAFHASMKNPFGKGSLIHLLRQFSQLHKDRKQISCGILGYPNVGKSSIINTLKGKKVATAAPIPGETKVWQFITLMKRIYLIDCPGIVPPNQNDTPEDLLLRSVVRLEKVDYPAQYIPGMMAKVKRKHLERTYDVAREWQSDDPTDFLEILARKSGRLLHGGEPDVDGVAKMVLNDFTRGKLPWFTVPPSSAKTEEDGESVIEGRQGRLGEMPRKRKRDDAESVITASMGPSTPAEAASDASEDEEEFDGVGSDGEEGAEDESDEGPDGDAEDMIPLDESSDANSVASDEDEESASDAEGEDLEDAGNEHEEADAPTARKPPPKRRRKA